MTEEVRERARVGKMRALVVVESLARVPKIEWLYDALDRAGIPRARLNQCAVVQADTKSVGKRVLRESIPELKRQIGERTAVLLVGNTALEAVTGKKGIKQKRGRPFEDELGNIYVPILPPGAAAYDERILPMMEADARLFADVVRGGRIPREETLDWTIVDTPEKFEALLQDLRGTVSFDIETAALVDGELKATTNPWTGHLDTERMQWVLDSRIVSIGFGCRGRQWCLPLNHPELDTQEALELTFQQIFAQLNRRMRDCYLVAHNGKFDSLWLRIHYGVDWRADFDTMLAHWMLDENQRHSLKLLAQMYLGAPNYDADLDVKAGLGSLYKHCLYLAHDVHYTRVLRFRFGRMMDEDLGVKRAFEHITMPIASLFVDIEHHGVLVDFDRFEEAEVYLRGELAQAERELHKALSECLPGYEPGSINWRSSKQLAKLFFEDLGLDIIEKTKSGKSASTSESVLMRIDHPAAHALMKFRSADQSLKMFIDGWRPFLVWHPDGWRLHPSFKLHGTVTGRASCVRRGTPVMVPGGTKPIEEIQPGDWVYTYDADRKLTLRRVTAAARTGVKRKLYRVHWVGQGGKTSGHLDVTGDHQIQLTDGRYVRADQLRGGRWIQWRKRYHGGEHVTALHRGVHKGRNHLYPTGAQRVREARAVFESVYGYAPEHVHHLDENPLNDSPDNLAGMSASDHLSSHSSAAATSVEMSRRAHVRSPEARLRNAEAVAAGSRRKAEARFTREQVIDALERGNGILGARRILGCSYDSLRWRIDEWGIQAPDGRKNRNNHMVTRVEVLSERDDVWDISVEGTHNFIAGELCVHNCEHPNLQQVPRDSLIRSLIISPDGWELFDMDLSQIEMRISAELSGDQVLLGIFQRGEDVHWMTALKEITRGAGMAEEILRTATAYVERSPGTPWLTELGWRPGTLGLEYGLAAQIVYRMGPDVAAEISPAWKELRKKAKAINFGYLFGMWWRKMIAYARDNYGVALTEKQAQESRKNFFDTYSALAPWHERQKRYARRHGYVRSLSGAKRRLPAAQLPNDCKERGEAQRQAINSPVQRFACELNYMVLLQLVAEFGLDVVRPIGTVHDAILAEIRCDRVAEVYDRVHEIMEHPAMLDELGIRLRVPIQGEAKIGPWSKGVSLKKWQEKRRERRESAESVSPTRSPSRAKLPRQRAEVGT